MFHVKQAAHSGCRFHVSRETSEPAFHVKQSVNRLNEGILLSDTEFPEDHVEYVLDIDPTQQPSEGIGRGTELFGR